MTFDMGMARSLATDPNFYGNAPYLAAHLVAALDEIERQAKRITKLESENVRSERAHEALDTIRKRRIVELESAYKIFLTANENTIKFEKKTIENIITALSMYEELERTIDRQRAALKKLGQVKRERGKALVEERARFIKFRCKTFYGKNEPIEKFIGHATNELHQEGKL